MILTSIQQLDILLPKLKNVALLLQMSVFLLFNRTCVHYTGILKRKKNPYFKETFPYFPHN